MLREYLHLWKPEKPPGASAAEGGCAPRFSDDARSRCDDARFPDLFLALGPDGSRLNLKTVLAHRVLEIPDHGRRSQLKCYAGLHRNLLDHGVCARQLRGAASFRSDFRRLHGKVQTDRVLGLRPHHAVDLLPYLNI